MNPNMNYNMYPNQYQTPMYPQYNMPKKKSKVWLIVLIPVCLFVLGLVVLYFIGSSVIKSGELIDGEWSCSGVSVEFNHDDKKFEMYSTYDKSELDVRGTYKVTSYNMETSNGETTYRYTTVLTAKERIYKGESYDGEITNNYEITLNDDEDELVMVNDEEGTYYICEKVD